MTTLWVPNSAKDARFKCELCNTPDFTRSELMVHLNKCLKVNEPQPPETNGFTAPLDPEQHAYMRRRPKGIVGGKI